MPGGAGTALATLLAGSGGQDKQTLLQGSVVNVGSTSNPFTSPIPFQVRVDGADSYITAVNACASYHFPTAGDRVIGSRIGKLFFVLGAINIANPDASTLPFYYEYHVTSTWASTPGVTSTYTLNSADFAATPLASSDWFGHPPFSGATFSVPMSGVYEITYQETWGTSDHNGGDWLIFIEDVTTAQFPGQIGVIHSPDTAAQSAESMFFWKGWMNAGDQYSLNFRVMLTTTGTLTLKTGIGSRFAIQSAFN